MPSNVQSSAASARCERKRIVAGAGPKSAAARSWAARNPWFGRHSVTVIIHAQLSDEKERGYREGGGYGENEKMETVLRDGVASDTLDDTDNRAGGETKGPN